MDLSYPFFLTIGGILLLGLLVSGMARHTFLPRVTLLLLFGILIGREGLNLIPREFTDQFEIIATMTLLMVGFLLGGKLTREALSDSTIEVLSISIAAALVTASTVFIGLLIAGVITPIALILGCIAAATAPAAILDVTEEMGGQGRFSHLLLSVVALDDVWALVLFGFGLTAVSMLNGNGSDSSYLMHVAHDIGGALVLGCVLGFPAAYLTGRVKKGQPMLSEALGLVFVCGGLALWWEVSYLVAAMVMGAIIANLAKHHDYPFHAIEGIESMFMVIFFVLAGASLELGALNDLGLIGGVYVLCRVFGKQLGGMVGSSIGGSNKPTRRWIGVALLPQAGVAIGMALVASNQFPEYRQLLLSVVISSTVLFELVGPVLTGLAIRSADWPVSTKRRS